MAGGYMGKLLLVNLSTREIEEEILDDNLCWDFIGGYGIGARIIYSRQKAGVDPLGPENIFGLLTGPLTGTPATASSRYTVVGKSPLTGGWGDANSGGHFGPHLKFAGYDGVFFTGISEKPVYLFIENGKAELRDATHLWGRYIFETDELLQNEHGKEAKVTSIGPAGEKLSLVSCIINQKNCAAGRSGLGAVMGSKKLKAVVVKGDQKVPVADSKMATRIMKEHVAELRETGFFQHIGESHADMAAHNGDSPVKNWGGIGIIDFPDVSGISNEAMQAYLGVREGCGNCALRCKVALKEGTDKYRYPAGTGLPKYETMASFGAMCLNNNAESIAMVNYICDNSGLDTISAGTIMAFAIECYENGLITKADTDGIELTWGNHQAIVAMTEKVARREGFGDILADGVKMAAEKIGKGAEEYAIHIGGQEPGMHDPKLGFKPGIPNKPGAAPFQMDPSPGRHTTEFGPTGFLMHLFNATGVCLQGWFPPKDPYKYMKGFMSAVTGWERSIDELLKAGERIGNMRHIFNLREGINPLERKVHSRIIGDPPQREGPLVGKKAKFVEEAYWCLGALDWDMVTTKPSKKKLLEMGLDDVAQELW